MGPPKRDRRKPKDRSSTSDRSRRRLDRKRRFAEARKRGVEAGRDLGEKPPVPHRYEYNRWKTTLDMTISYVNRAAVDIGVEFLSNQSITGAGGLMMPLHQAREFVKAVGELTDANRAESRNIGTFYSLNIVGRDARIGRNPHIQEGKPYTANELRERTRQSYGDRMAYEGRTLRIETRNAPTEVDQGINQVVDAANSVLKAAKNPADRRAGLEALMDSVQQKIQANRQQRLTDMQR